MKDEIATARPVNICEPSFGFRVSDLGLPHTSSRFQIPDFIHP